MNSGGRTQAAQFIAGAQQLPAEHLRWDQLRDLRDEAGASGIEISGSIYDPDGTFQPLFLHANV